MWYMYFRRIALATSAIILTLVTAVGLLVVNTVQITTETEREVLHFPFVIEGTQLVAEYFVSYEGDYFEDNSGEFLIDGAALCVYNQSDDHLDFASVCLETAEGVYCFEGTCIPPKTKVIMLEKYKASYPKAPVYLASGRSLVSRRRTVMNNLHIDAIDIGTIRITNDGKEVLDDVYIYYKRYDSVWDVYIGGITYAVSVGMLKPGQQVTLSPSNYASGYSKALYATEK